MICVCNVCSCDLFVRESISVWMTSVDVFVSAYDVCECDILLPDDCVMHVTSVIV